MPKYEDQLKETIEQHNQLHNNIQVGREQIAAMERDKERLIGKIQFLEELAREEQGQELGADALPTGPEQPAPEPDPEG